MQPDSDDISPEGEVRRFAGVSEEGGGAVPELDNLQGGDSEQLGVFLPPDGEAAFGPAVPAAGAEHRDKAGQPSEPGRHPPQPVRGALAAQQARGGARARAHVHHPPPGRTHLPAAQGRVHPRR